MKHLFIKKELTQRVLVLLHGTGGNEESLLPVANIIDPHASILAIRGEVNEQGALRYFKRKAEGIYDLEDLQYRAQQLKEFILNASKNYGFQLEQVVLVGFSNGSNIAIEMLLNKENPFKQSILMSPMFPLDNPSKTELADLKVFVSMGVNDPIVPVEESHHVMELFSDRGAEVTAYWTNGHEINLPLLENVKKWLNS